MVGDEGLRKSRETSSSNPQRYLQRDYGRDFIKKANYDRIRQSMPQIQLPSGTFHTLNELYRNRCSLSSEMIKSLKKDEKQ